MGAGGAGSDPPGPGLRSRSPLPGPGRGWGGAGKGPGRGWAGEGAAQGHPRPIDRPTGRCGHATAGPAPCCPQAPGGESPARAPSSRPARRGRGAGPAPAPRSLRPPLRRCSRRSSPLPLPPLPPPLPPPAMSADPVVFVSAARTAVGEAAGPGRSAGPGSGCAGAERSVSPQQAPSTAGCRRSPRTSWAPPPSARCCAAPGCAPRRCPRWCWARSSPQVRPDIPIRSAGFSHWNRAGLSCQDLIPFPLGTRFLNKGLERRRGSSPYALGYLGFWKECCGE